MSNEKPPNADPVKLESSPVLQAEHVAFTGTLASMTHQKAGELAEEHGGTAMQHVSRQTTMLVIGEEGWPLDPDGQPSQKLRYARELIGQGRDIQLVKESNWLALLGLREEGEEVRRLYTPAMLSKLLDVPVGQIRGWERQGLIQPVRKIYRLPYFDYSEVTGARRLTELLAAGISRQRLRDSLQNLQDLWPDLNRPLGQLDLLVEGRRVLYRDGGSLLEPLTRQRFFDFEISSGKDTESQETQGNEASFSQGSDNAETHLAHQSPDVLSLPTWSPLRPEESVSWTTDEWLEAGQNAADAGQISEAIAAFRLCLLEQPHDPELHFQLAECLYRQGMIGAATERYYAAVECDHHYIEAWTQLGCVLEEQNRPDEALSAFDVALEFHPDYPDAHRHKAAVLESQGRSDEARTHWETYLKFDRRGPWANEARERLGSSH